MEAISATRWSAVIWFGSNGSTGALDRLAIVALQESTMPATAFACATGVLPGNWMRDRHVVDPFISYIQLRFMKWLLEGADRNRVVNLLDFFRQRIREVLARRAKKCVEPRSRVPPNALSVQTERERPNKIIRQISVEITRPRGCELSGQCSKPDCRMDTLLGRKLPERNCVHSGSRAGMAFFASCARSILYFATNGQPVT